MKVRRSVQRGLAACLLAAVASGAIAEAEGPAAAAAPRAEIDAAVAQLASEIYWQRREALRKLWGWGRAAWPALEHAAQQREKSLEAALAAETILDRFRWGMFPDTPRRLQDLIRQYRAGNPQEKTAVLFALMDAGDDAYPTLLALVTAQSHAQPSALREEGELPAGRPASPGLAKNDTESAFSAVELKALTTAREAILAGRPGEAEKWLRVAALTGRSQAIRHYAAFLMTRGDLDARRAEFTALRHGPLSGNAARLTAHLHRAAGDLRAALELAQRSRDEDLTLELWYELGDWDRLAEQQEQFVAGETAPSIEELSFLLAYERLAGREAAEEVSRKKLVERLAAADGEEFWYVAEALLTNDAVDEALVALRTGKRYVAAFDLLVRQQRFAEALALADEAAGGPAAKAADNDDDDDDEKPTTVALRLRVRQARLRFALGEHEAARQTLAALAEAQLRGDPRAGLPIVLEAERFLGLTDALLAHAAAALAHEAVAKEPQAILNQVFPKRGAAAAGWWSYFSGAEPRPSPIEALRAVARVLERPADVPDLAGLLRDVEAVALEMVGNERSDFHLALVETALQAGRKDLANESLARAAETTGSAAVHLKWGDVLRDLRQFAAAAQAYQRARELDEGDALPLYLEGASLADDGQTAEGRKRIDAALAWPLGDDARRHRLAQGLLERGFTDDADRLFLATRRVAAFRSWELGFALRREGNRASRRQEFQQAAVCFERSMLDVLRTSTAFVETDAYLTVPYLVHKHRARALAGLGKWEEALAEARRGLRALPGDIDLPIQLVPALARAGRTAEADALFETAIAFQRRQCEAFPASAQRHNQLAWLSACCRRDLDVALAHAQRAVALAPRNAAYVDTLAEVQFQRGARAEALTLALQCLELEPGNNYFRSNVARYTAPGPPNEPGGDAADE